MSTSQDDIAELYHKQAKTPLWVKKRGAHVAGAAFGFSNLVMNGLYGLAFWYGGRLMRSGTESFEDFLIAFFSILFSAMGATEVRGWY